MTYHDESVLVLDVDGIINTDQSAWGTDAQLITCVPPDPYPAITFHPAVPGWLRHLASLADQVLWNTSWNEAASTWVAPALGLTAGWDWVQQPRTHHITFGWSSKIAPLYPLLDRCSQVVVLDDIIGGKDACKAEDRGWLMPEVDLRGLTEDIYLQAAAYLGEG